MGGDIDNHIKLVLDSLEAVLYHNDRQVVRLMVEKKYCDDCNERTEIFCSSENYDPLNNVEVINLLQL